MAAVEIAAPVQRARVTYNEPNILKDPWDCGYFAVAQPKNLTEADIDLHDCRPEIFSESSPYRLETHCFTAVKHKSVILQDAQARADAIREDSELITGVYLPEVQELVKKVTGCRKVFPVTCAVRSAPAKTKEQMLVDRSREDCGFKLDVDQMDLSGPVLPKGLGPVGPQREMHVDYSPDGVRQMLRNMRFDILEEARDIIAAEDEAAASSTTGKYQGRRYAVYSVWRPLKPVMRDPVAMLDPNTCDPERDLVEFVTKRPGEMGPFLSGLQLLARGAEGHRWYWISEQREDEVLFIQHFDSHAIQEGRPLAVPHGSPGLYGVEDKPLRESIEVRVVAFW